MKTRKQPLPPKALIPPVLVHIWNNLSYLPCPTSIERYIVFTDAICRVYRNYANMIFMTLYKPIHHTQQIVGGIEYEMSWILSTTNDITTECKKHVLSRRSKRILFRMRNKNELIWEKFYKKFLELKTANEELLFIEHTDVLAQEMPYTKNFSVILHHFQRYSFQRN